MEGKGGCFLELSNLGEESQEVVPNEGASQEIIKGRVSQWKQPSAKALGQKPAGHIDGGQRKAELDWGAPERQRERRKVRWQSLHQNWGG